MFTLSLISFYVRIFTHQIKTNVFKLANLTNKLVSSASKLKSNLDYLQKKMSQRRDVSGILQKVRDYMLGRQNMNFLRFRDDLSARTQPPPVLPEGSNQKLSANYYYTRDARRLVKPQEVIVDGSRVLQLGEGAGVSEKPPSVVNRVPGKVHLWDG